MELRIIFVIFTHLSTATGAAISHSNNCLSYFAVFDDVMYPPANHTLYTRSHVTLVTCADICFDKSIHSQLLLKQSVSVGPGNSSEQKTANNSIQSQINQSEQKVTCSAFEYIASIGYCILLTHSAAHNVQGYRSLKQAKGTAYFELSTSLLGLYQKKENTVLDGENTYQSTLNSSSVTDCASECMKATDLTCNSFAYSVRMRICAISSHVPDGVTSLQTTDSYDYFQYSGVWPCNVTLYWAYAPRVIASHRYPYVYHGHFNCYFRLVAPPGQQIILQVKTFFTNQTACKESSAGVFIFDGEGHPTKESDALCQMSDSKRRPFFRSSNGTMLVQISQTHNLVIARMTYGYANKSNCCASSPCLFNAVCVETGNSFNCICRRGTFGKRCEKFIGECYRNPCMNGTCNPSGSVPGYRCACVNGFTGANCEYNINECFSSPCLHGQCEDLINGYRCVCKEPYTGRHCELNKSLALCSRTACRFGTCAVNRTGSYCQCFPGFTGFFCETDIDNCYNSPCAHGACVDHVNSYECSCSSGYAGKHCDILVGDPCRGNPCYHGYCSVGNEGFICICESGYTGTKCESELTVCHSECRHGYCIKMNISDSKCICYDNFTGKNCEKLTLDCKDGFCMGNHNISSISLNGNESFYSTYKPFVNERTQKLTVTPILFTTSSIKRQPGRITSVSYTRPNASNASYQYVTFSSPKDVYQSQFPTKFSVSTSKTLPKLSQNAATSVLPTKLTSRTTENVQSVLSLASTYSTAGSGMFTKKPPSTKNNLETTSPSLNANYPYGGYKSNQHTTSKLTAHLTDQYGGYSTKQTSIVPNTMEQKATNEKFRTRTESNKHTKEAFTTERNYLSTLPQLSHKTDNIKSILATTTTTKEVPSYTFKISSITDTLEATVSSGRYITKQSTRAHTGSTRSSGASPQGMFTFLSTFSSPSTDLYLYPLYNETSSVPSTILHASTNTATMVIATPSKFITPPTMQTPPTKPVTPPSKFITPPTMPTPPTKPVTLPKNSVTTPNKPGKPPTKPFTLAVTPFTTPPTKSSTSLINVLLPTPKVVTPTTLSTKPVMPPTNALKSSTKSVTPSTKSISSPTDSFLRSTRPVTMHTKAITSPSKSVMLQTKSKTPPTKPVTLPTNAMTYVPSTYHISLKTVTKSTLTGQFINATGSKEPTVGIMLTSHETITSTPTCMTFETNVTYSIAENGESVNDVITIESIVIGALFVTLILVLAIALFACYKRAHSGTVYISSSEPSIHRDRTSVKKRYSSREIHSDLKSGKLFQPQYVSSELYQRQDEARKQVYDMPKRRLNTEVSSKASSLTTSPVSSRSDKYDEVESPDYTLPKKIRRLVPVHEPTDGKNVVNIALGDGVITPATPETGRLSKQNKSFDSNDTGSCSERDLHNSSLSSNENPFFKRDDGTVVLSLSKKQTSNRTQEEFQSLLEEILDAEDLTLRRPGMRKSMHYISGAEAGRSDA